jgi:hypothetical protein
MGEPLTPEQIREKIIAELKAEALADIESEEEWERQLSELRQTGREPIEPLLAELDRMVEKSRCAMRAVTTRSFAPVE